MKERDYGIDFVKVLAVIFVILHHTVDWGFTMVDNPSFGLRTIWYTTHSVSLTCVNLFALITGYLCVTSNNVHKRLTSLWLQVFFIGVAISGIGALAGLGVGAGDWLKALFPVMTGEYWYFTAYFIVCLFIPFVNPGARSLDKRTFSTILLTFFLLVGLSSLFMKKDPLVLKNGYCFAWLLIVYLFGAYWRLHVEKRPNLFVCIAILGVFSFAFLIPSIGKRVFAGDVGAWFAAFEPVKYTSPFTFAMSLAIFGICRHVEIRRPIARQIVLSISNKSLGMYLWLVHPVFWHSFWRPYLSRITIRNVPEFAAYVLLVVTCSFLSALLLESLRQRLFSRVGKLIDSKPFHTVKQ